MFPMRCVPSKKYVSRWDWNQQPIDSETKSISTLPSVQSFQAFALATSFWVGEHVKYYNKLSPFLPSLPLLCSVATQEQSNFWRSLLGVEGRSSGEKSTSVASGGGTPNKGRNVIQSLQLIRGVVPGMPTAVLVSLAKSFQKLVSYKVCVYNQARI